MKMMPVLLTAGLACCPAFAATIGVTTLGDDTAADGLCSLREAISAATSDAAVDACAAGAGTDVVVLPSGTLSVTALLSITGDITVRGAGAVTVIRVAGAPLDVRGAVAFEDLTLQGSGGVGAIRGQDADLTLRRVAVIDTVSAAGAVSMQMSVAAVARPTVTVIDSVFLRNSGSSALVSQAGSVIVLRSTFADNTVGAVVATGDVAQDSVRLDSSTFSGNSAPLEGGAAHLTIPATIDSCTFVDNTAAASGGAVFADASVAMRNSIAIDNVAPAGPACFTNDLSGISAGDNTVDSDVDCPMNGARDVVDVQLAATDVLLPLADNGGLTPTRLPLVGGQGADQIVATGNNCGGLFTDQRGARRDTFSCDRGAAEARAIFMSPAMAVSVVLPGVACPFGGQRIAIGLDDGGGVVSDAGDGVLSAAEEDSASVLCAATPAVTLISVEDDDGTCPDGGIQVHSGADDNANGILDVAERDRTDHLCNGVDGGDGGDGADGADGPRGPAGPGGDNGADGQNGANGNNGGAGSASLVRTSVINPGDQGCVAGGQLIEAGVDDGAGGGVSGDGTLSDGEVDSSAVLCNGRSFEDEFETTGGPSCASSHDRAPSPMAAMLAALAISIRRRRR